MERRTALITAASIAGVVLTGATAVGANIGILDRANETGVGQLSAATAVAEPAETEIVDVYLPEASLASATTENPRQSFEVESAGTVEIHHGADGLRLGEVTPNDGWTWSAGQAGDDSLTVTFDSAETGYRFTATRSPDGTVVAAVDEVVIAAPSPGNGAASSRGGYGEDEGEHEGDEYEDDDEGEHEGDEYEDDDEHEHEDDEYEDDDEHEDDEHEGRDDDD